MVGRWDSFWNGPFLGTCINFRVIALFELWMVPPPKKVKSRILLRTKKQIKNRPKWTNQKARKNTTKHKWTPKKQTTPNWTSLKKKSIYRTRLYHHFTISPMGGLLLFPWSFFLAFGKSTLWPGWNPQPRGRGHGFEWEKYPVESPYRHIMCENIRRLDPPEAGAHGFHPPLFFGCCMVLFYQRKRWWVFHAFPICAISFDLKVTGRSAFLFGCTCPRGHRRLDLAEFVESLE